MKRYILFFSFFLVIAGFDLQSQTHTDFYERTLDINKSGMYLLGGWALANMVTGTYGSLKYSGEQKYFHQMNAAWNLVNAGIATYALFDIMGKDISMLSQAEVMHEQLKTERIFLINAGLDILYMAGGAWMINAAGKNEKRHDLLKGYGQSVILQGGFLFLFDLSKYLIQRNHRLNFDESFINIGSSADGLSLIIRF